MSEPAEKLVTSLKDEFLECPVCVDHFDQTNRRPRLLQTCLHAVCNECIDKLLEKEGRGQLTCPLCRHVTKVKGKASSLPADTVRNKLVDFLHMKQQKKIKCTDCPDGNDAEWKCDECQSYLCKECINAHRRNRLSRDHSIISIEDSLKVPIRELSRGHFCLKHPKHDIEFYCTTDDKLCCLSCTVIDHKGHQFEEIQDAATKRKSSLYESIQIVHKTKDGIQQRKKSMKTKRSAVEQMKKESERNINKMIDDMKLQLDQRRNQLLSELEQESLAMLSVIEKTSASYDTTLAIIESTDTYFTQTKEKADDVEMLQMYPAIKRSVDALQRQSVAVDVRIDRIKFSPIQKAGFDGLVSKLGAFGHQDPPSLEVQHIPAVPRTMTVTQQDGCTVAQGKTLTVKLYKGDMTTLTADVIIREIESQLVPWGNVSRSVAAAAGPRVSDQLQRIRREEGRASDGSLFVTDAGRLPYKKIFNLAGPYNIREGTIKCLCEATNRKLTSVAFQCFYALLQPWHEAMVQAVRSFDHSVTGGSLQEVHFVADDDKELSGWGEQIWKIWTRVSRIEKKDIDVIWKHLKPSSGAFLAKKLP